MIRIFLFIFLTCTSVFAQSTQQQKEWLLAQTIVDLRFDEDKVFAFEKRLDGMSDTQIAALVLAYQKKQEYQKERQKVLDERAKEYAKRKHELAMQSRYYYHYRYHYSNPSYYMPKPSYSRSMYQTYR